MTARVGERLDAEPAVAAVRAALADLSEDAWLVGGTVRDALLGRPVRDVDVVVRGDPESAARAVARAEGGASFSLSESFPAWRAIGGGGAWVCDVSPLQGSDIAADLAHRDFTVNAMAVPLAGGDLIDPHGGAGDLGDAVLRLVSDAAYREDPLRPLRMARMAAELGLRPDPRTEELTERAAPAVASASPERVFAELRRLVLADDALEGLALADRLGLIAAVLPELASLHGVEQSHFHHLDVHDHTLEVLSQQIRLEGTLEEVFGELAPGLAAVLAEPLADELNRREALRLGALLHDVGKPATRGERPDGRVTFIGHDAVGADIVSGICRRLRTSDSLRRFLADLTRHHLVLGFMVHERPLGPRAVYRYLSLCAPVEVEVTVLSCADRLATRGQNADTAIAAHLDVARQLMAAALRWRSEGPPRPPVRGDDLARELDIEPGPELGALLEELRAATFAGEVGSRAEAVELARRLRQNWGMRSSG